jgi:hypothetical protein
MPIETPSSGETKPDPMFSENLRGVTCAAHRIISDPSVWDEPHRSPCAGFLKTSDPGSYSPDDGVSIRIRRKSLGNPSGVRFNHIPVHESKFWQKYCAAKVFQKPVRGDLCGSLHDEPRRFLKILGRVCTSDAMVFRSAYNVNCRELRLWFVCNTSQCTSLNFGRNVVPRKFLKNLCG